MTKKASRKKAPRAPRAPTVNEPVKDEPTRAIGFGDVELCLPYLKSQLTPKLRLHTVLNARQGRALRAIFDGFQDTDTKRKDGRDITRQDHALCHLLDMIADGAGL